MNRARVAELTRAQWRAFRRDRTALFFTLAFPLMFLVAFAALLGDPASSRTPVLVAGTGAVVDNLPEDILEVERVTDEADALRRVREGDEPALVTQRGDVVTIRFAASDPVQAGTITGVVEAVAGRASAAGGPPPRYTVQAVQVEDESLTAIEFYTPSLLGWGVAISAVFGAALTLVTWRDRRILRRLRLAPVRLGEIAVSRVAVSALIALVQIALYVGVAVAFFDLSLSSSWWMCVPITIAGTLAFLAIGLLVGAVSKTVEAASAVANLVTLPMAFLSGAFFPLDNAPGWMQAVAQAMPMTHVIEGLTDTMVRDLGPASALPEIGILLAFTAVAAAVAVHPRVFRWDAT